ncbi:hypothetical protein QRX50_07180 [Amycolatopsis carbonis]|uniref:Uncharacterized protein n=1 Tax=Amycolatopsis carbonis TaxID=715471 RepID=A0A9Y2MTD2_9PSEU|nr:hypothetical protein [Amycolatopsis sp. 2-15]WIX80545.1 hypothetical protein QRX50_07180 [Amycolatopsis sp. 2-15]
MTVAPEIAPAGEKATDPTAEPDEQQSAPLQDGPEQLSVTGTSVGGDNNGTVINQFAPEKEVRANLVEGPVTDDLITHATRAFCHPERFSRAALILRKRRLVVLSGRSSGRSLAGVRLLIDRNVGTLQRLDPARSLKDFVSSVKRRSGLVGYLWDDHTGTGWADPDGERTLGQLEHTLRAMDAYLVVAFNSDVSLKTVQEYVTELSPPPTSDVAHAHLKAKGISPERCHELLTQIKLSEVLPGYSKPRRGAEVARLLAEVEAGQYSFDEVAQTLYRNKDHDVQDWFTENTNTATRALGITVALLEGCPYNEIASAAKKLEDVLTNPENKEIWPYTPPDLFERTREEQLNNVHATISPRLGADDGLTNPERVRFTRPGWGMRLLRYAWKEFDRIRPLLHEWLGGLSEELPEDSDAQREVFTRFGKLIAASAEPGPLQWVRPWLETYGSGHHHQIAAITLGALCTNASYVQTVKDHLNWWARPTARTRYRHAVAIACRAEFGKAYPEFAMKQLGRLTKNCDSRLRALIPPAVRELLQEPSNRSLVLSSLAFWLAGGGAQARAMAYKCSIDALSLNQAPVTFASREESAIRMIFAALMTNTSYRPAVIKHLAAWSSWSSSGPHTVANQALLRILLTGDPSLMRRLGYDLRKYIERNEEGSKHLARQLALTLKDI